MKKKENRVSCILLVLLLLFEYECNNGNAFLSLLSIVRSSGSLVCNSAGNDNIHNFIQSGIGLCDVAVEGKRLALKLGHVNSVNDILCVELILEVVNVHISTLELLSNSLEHLDDTVVLWLNLLVFKHVRVVHLPHDTIDRLTIVVRGEVVPINARNVSVHVFV